MMSMKRSKNYLDVLMMVLTVFVALYLDWGINLIFISVALVYVFLNPPKSEKLAYLSFFFLLFVPVFTLISMPKQAEYSAQIFFSLFLISIILMFRELLNSSNSQIEL